MKDTALNFNSLTNSFEFLAATSVAPLAQGQVSFIDWSSTAGADADGSIARPYPTIQGWLDTIPVATTAAQERRNFVGLVASGTYDEDLLIPLGDTKKIEIIALGDVQLGTFDAMFWAPSGVPRNITWTVASDALGTGIRQALVISCLEQVAEGAVTHEAYTSKFRISGNLACVNDVLTQTTSQLRLNCEIFGNLDASAYIGSLQAYLYRTRVRGNLVGNTASTRIQVAENCQFDGTLAFQRFARLDSCVFGDAGGAARTFTITSATADIQPSGMRNCFYNTGLTFSGPAGSFKVDAYSNYWAITNAVTLAGGATKVVYGSLAP